MLETSSSRFDIQKNQHSARKIDSGVASALCCSRTKKNAYDGARQDYSDQEDHLKLCMPLKKTRASVASTLLNPKKRRKNKASVWKRN